MNDLDQLLAQAQADFAAAKNPADLENARMQIVCWAADRDTASALAKQVEDALLAAPAPVQATRLGARVSVVDDDTGLRGARHQAVQRFADHQPGEQRADRNGAQHG